MSIAVITVVITGANRGIGLALARHYASSGATVIAGCRNPRAATDLAATGAEVHALDVSSADSIAAFASAIGNRPVNVLINNAGIDAKAVGAEDSQRGALALSPEHFMAVMNVNVAGPMRLVQLLADNLRSATGTVVNIGSQVGSFAVAQKMGRDVSYAASKVALNMVSLKQAQAFRPDGVIVLAMHPGYVRSDMGGPGADIEPSESAAGIANVVASANLDMSGSFLRWDGSVHPW
jgi:NAD(P)-dependent dehydrogenase (short-subunit alcohol dehydrogenase family)